MTRKRYFKKMRNITTQLSKMYKEDPTVTDEQVKKMNKCKERIGIPNFDYYSSYADAYKEVSEVFRKAPFNFDC